MDDYRRALLGDHAAARRLTAAGKVLPCHRCGGRAEVEEQIEDPPRRGVKAMVRIVCTCCRFALASSVEWDMESADERMRLIEQWNTRAQVLSAKEIAELERIERCW